jgi:predicted anti-sigma-YlaC factor YlaD
MSKHHHSQEMVKQLCDQLGENWDAPLCREVAAHLKECPNCKINFDTVKKTIMLCRQMEEKKDLPPGALQRLRKILQLDKIF